MAYITVTLLSTNTDAQNETLISNALTNSSDGDTIIVTNNRTTAGNALTSVQLTNSLVIANKALRIVGTGNRDITLIAAAGKPIFEMTHTGDATYDRLEILNFTLTGNSTATHAIYFNYSAPGVGSVRKYDHVRLNNLTISNFDRGINALIPYTDAGSCICTLWTIDNCEISNCRAYGVYIAQVTNASIRNCEIKTCGNNGINAYGCINFSVRDTIVDGCNTLNIAAGPQFHGGCQVLMTLCHPFTFSNVYVRNFTTNAAAARTGLVAYGCESGYIEGYRCDFPAVNSTEFYPNSVGIQLTGYARGIKIETLCHSMCTTPIAVDRTSEFPTYDKNSIIQLYPGLIESRSLQ